MTQQCLDDSNIGAALKQVGRKAVTQRVQRHALLDSGRLSRLMEQAAQLAGGHRLSVPDVGKQPALLRGRRGIVARWSQLPPLAQQIERLRRQHEIAVLAALGLLDANDLLCAVDMLDLQPHHLAGAQAAAIAETEQHANLEATGDGQQATCLVRAHHHRNLLRFTQVIDLGGKIQSPQRHAEQEPQPGHDLVAVTDAQAGLGQMQLEPAHVLGHSRFGRALEKLSEPLAAADMTPLRARTELARVHVLDHALTQRGDGIRTHGQLLSWMRLTTPRSSRQRPLHRYRRSLTWLMRSSQASPPLSRSDLVLWPIAEMTAAGRGVRLLGSCGLPLVFATRNRVPCPPASAIRASPVALVAKFDGAD